MPECQCHGLNPSCYLCNGTGWVRHGTVIMRGHSEAEPQEKTKRDPLVLPPYISKRKAQFGSKCPYCGETKIRLNGHIRAKHPETTRAKRLVRRATDLRRKGRLFADRDQKSTKWLGKEKGPVGTPAEPSQPNTLNKEGEAMIIGTVMNQGVRADGKDIYELYISAGSDRLPHEYGKDKPIDIRIGNFVYEASVHQTQKGTVWLSSVLFEKGSRREKVRLVDALAKIKVKKWDKIRIKSNEEGIYLLEKMKHHGGLS